MSEDIYKKLGFKKAKELVYNKDIVDEAKNIFNELPLKNIGIRPLIVAKNIFEESLAISTAEDSGITAQIAKKIKISEEQEARLLKYKNNKKLNDNQKYDQLEFENINTVEQQINNLSFKELSIELLCNLHHDLSIGLDEYAKSRGDTSYHSGNLRKSDRVKVGKIRQYKPPESKKIQDLLKTLFKEFAEKKTIHLYDILEFHILLYAIHPFQNGNKRVARILESMLLNYYGYSVERTISLAIYYIDKKDDSNFFLMESLIRKDVTPFINFAIRGYFFAGQKIINITQSIYLKDFNSGFKNYIEENIKLSQEKNYKQALTAILKTNGSFTYTEFIQRMKKLGATTGIAQSVIENLLTLNILQKREGHYSVGKALEIENLKKKMNLFCLQNNISIID